jgi:hypothetical protein
MWFKRDGRTVGCLQTRGDERHPSLSDVDRSDERVWREKQGLKHVSLIP